MCVRRCKILLPRVWGGECSSHFNDTNWNALNISQRCLSFLRSSSLGQVSLFILMLWKTMPARRHSSPAFRGEMNHVSHPLARPLQLFYTPSTNTTTNSANDAWPQTACHVQLRAVFPVSLLIIWTTESTLNLLFFIIWGYSFTVGFGTVSYRVSQELWWATVRTGACTHTHEPQ